MSVSRRSAIHTALENVVVTLTLNLVGAASKGFGTLDYAFITVGAITFGRNTFGPRAWGPWFCLCSLGEGNALHILLRSTSGDIFSELRWTITKRLSELYHSTPRLAYVGQLLKISKPAASIHGSA